MQLSRFFTNQILFTAPMVLVVFTVGSFVQYDGYLRTNQIPIFNKDVFGVDVGPLTLGVMYLNIFSSTLTYFLTLTVTYTRRKELQKAASEVIEIMDILMGPDYKAHWDSSSLARSVNLIIMTILSYNLIFILGFYLFTNLSGPMVVIPIAYFFQLVACSLSTFDFCLYLFLLNKIFVLFQRIPNRNCHRKLFEYFHRSLDILETMSNGYGLREYFNIANEFVLVLTQIFVIYYVISTSTSSTSDIIIFGIINTLPRMIKVLGLAYIGERISVLVRFEFILT